MNRNANDAGTGKGGKNEGMLEKLAQAVDPPGREISDEEILDPGANIPREPMERVDRNKPAGGDRH
ncbi:hypothetical protein [Noviherbaspirillum aridicola]|uniref:Uncharacterized protein n=1 Tax=Noviherbaspirillum aridicola TaxID=2849687 RepID=A0ABQ4Q6J1_9BURK|nr:hypothetical protein [Noviherbaspirillum aridicola]GIZ52844.1 hypothetical protein NCCP691_28580 [Noviherbaspirillum aridicola]